ncbi:MAG: hypothetical protein K2L96_03930 [Muribaculaceae bacterium]|nr:hypothetical protein [Muribaculaceae bacterium]
MLKKLRQTILATLTLFSFLAVCADTIPPKLPGNGGGDQPPIVIGGRTADRPSNVNANLSGDELTIVFEQSEGRVWVEVSDTSMAPVQAGYYDSEAPIIIPVHDAETPLLIYISTEYGTEYEGWIQ